MEFSIALTRLISARKLRAAGVRYAAGVLGASGIFLGAAKIDYLIVRTYVAPALIDIKRSGHQIENAVFA